MSGIFLSLDAAKSQGMLEQLSECKDDCVDNDHHQQTAEESNAVNHKMEP